ncbi:hypothetical protein [Acinetobacter baumannii]|uniref:hypothetical protein n=1 Tax=Acinetobacter baumannii TaxID=470 RepID=UPI003219BF04
MGQISEKERNQIYARIDKKFSAYFKARTHRIDKYDYQYDSFNALVKTVIEPAGLKIEYFMNYTAQEKIEKTLYCCNKLGLDQFNTRNMLLIWSDDALKILGVYYR